MSEELMASQHDENPKLSCTTPPVNPRSDPAEPAGTCLSKCLHAGATSHRCKHKKVRMSRTVLRLETQLDPSLHDLGLLELTTKSGEL